MSQLAPHLQKQKHHPEWTNIYNQVFIRWTTHNPRGLSEKDVRMAKLCDELASQIGEVVKSTQTTNEAGHGKTGKGIEDKAKENCARINADGDCCAKGKT